MRSTAEITAVTMPRPANTRAHVAKLVSAPSVPTTIPSKIPTIALPRPVAKLVAASTTVETIEAATEVAGVSPF